MSVGNDLSTYTELADLLDSLPLIMREARRARRVTLRDVTAATGVAQSTLSRMERGGDDGELGPRAVSLGNAILLLRWLDQSSGHSEGESDS